MYLADGMCGNKIYKEYLSPDQLFKAVVFQRDCGTTTGFQTHISILDSKEILANEGGNIFIIRGRPDDVAPLLKWTGHKVLHIKHTLNGDEIKSKSKFGYFQSVKIIYN